MFKRTLQKHQFLLVLVFGFALGVTCYEYMTTKRPFLVGKPRTTFGTKRRIDFPITPSYFRYSIPSETSRKITQVTKRPPFAPKGFEKELVEILEGEIMSRGVNVSWSDIAGCENAKQLLMEAVVWPGLMPDVFKGIRRSYRGVLLYGPPGTGKTMLAKAVATGRRSTFFNIKVSSLMSKWLGESTKLMRLLFEMARYYKPSIIFIDEIDSLASQRGGDTEHESSRRLKSELLIQMEGLSTEENSGVIVIGATNFPWSIDEALRRRLEKRIYIPLPDESARLDMLRMNMRNMPFEEELKLEDVAKALDGYSGDDVRMVCRDAAMMAPREKLVGLSELEIRANAQLLGNLTVTKSHFDEAIRRVRPTVSQNDLEKYNEWTLQYGST